MSLKTAHEFRAAGEEATAAYYRALASVSSDELEMEFKTNWGQTLSVDAMMEHALCHLLRHRRQLQIFLGDRVRARVNSAT